MTKPTFVDLFSGAGGLSLGLQNAGWQPILAIDNWYDAIATYRRNMPEHPVRLADVRELKDKDIPWIAPGHVDWVVGGSPCQGFSTIGKRLRADPRNAMIREFRRFVEILSPEGFILENVIGLQDMQFEQAVSTLFEDLGYSVTSQSLYEKGLRW